MSMLFRTHALACALGLVCWAPALGQGCYVERAMPADTATRDYQSQQAWGTSYDGGVVVGQVNYTDPTTKQPKTENGSYLTVYRKAADGSWKAAEDFTTPGPAAAPAPAAE